MGRGEERGAVGRGVIRKSGFTRRGTLQSAKEQREKRESGWPDWRGGRKLAGKRECKTTREALHLPVRTVGR